MIGFEDLPHTPPEAGYVFKFGNCGFAVTLVIEVPYKRKQMQRHDHIHHWTTNVAPFPINSWINNLPEYNIVRPEL